MIMPIDPPPTWSDVRILLTECSQDYNRHAPEPWRNEQLFQGEPPDDGPDYAARLAAYEAACRPAIETAIQSLLTTGQTGPIEAKVKYLLGVRVDVCIAFAALLSTSDGRIPCDFETQTSAAQWLLIDWWNLHGPTLATYRVVED
jgi:hypothetical protein